MSETKTILVVADVYKLARHGKKFTDNLDQAILKYKDHLIERTYADEMNNRWQSTGTRVVIDEDASTERAEQLVADAAVRLADDEARELAGRAVASLALGIKKSNATQDNTPEVNEELEAAFQEYEELYGESAHPRSGLKKLKEKIEAKKAELN